MNEERYIVKISTNALFMQFPDTGIDMVPWDSIQRITVTTNDSGPTGSDMWWNLECSDRTVDFPAGATGESDFLQHVQQWPGFSNDAVIEAAQSTDNATFLCWERSARV